jgi:hypothetical protein
MRYFSNWRDENTENVDPNGWCDGNRYAQRDEGKENVDIRAFFGSRNQECRAAQPLGVLSTNRLRSCYTDLLIDAAVKHPRQHDEFEMKQLRQHHDEEQARLAKRQRAEVDKMRMDHNIRQVIRQGELRKESAHNLAAMTDRELLLELCRTSDRFFSPTTPPHALDALDAV